MDTAKRGRGRPAGSGKRAEERRQRKDYRLSPAALRQIEQGRRLAQSTATAFVEEAISHYVEVLTREVTIHQSAQPPIQVPDLVVSQLTDTRTQPKPTRPPIERKQPAAPPTQSPAQLPSSLRQPVYQIFLKHEPGSAHPDLPEGFTYMDQHKSIQPEQCPTHRVFARPCAIAVARQQVEHLKRTSGVIAIWILDRSGKALARDSWRKDQGRWVKND